MSDFKVINTQEELDAVINERLSRVAKKYSDYDEIKTRNSEYEKQLGDLQSQIKEFANSKSAYENQIKELNVQVQGFQTNSIKSKIAIEYGLPYEFAARLQGSNEEEIKKDAEKLATIFVPKTQGTPIVEPEQSPTDDKTSALKSLLNNIKEK